jgi:hypothetical protein
MLSGEVAKVVPRCVMRKNVWLFSAAFLLGIGSTGVGQTRPTLKKLTAFDLPGPAGKRFDYHPLFANHPPAR